MLQPHSCPSAKILLFPAMCEKRALAELHRRALAELYRRALAELYQRALAELYRTVRDSDFNARCLYLIGPSSSVVWKQENPAPRISLTPQLSGRASVILVLLQSIQLIGNTFETAQACCRSSCVYISCWHVSCILARGLLKMEIMFYRLALWRLYLQSRKNASNILVNWYSFRNYCSFFYTCKLHASKTEDNLQWGANWKERVTFLLGFSLNC